MSARRAAACIGGLVLAASCGVGGASRSTAHERTVDAPASVTSEPPSRGRVIGGERVQRTIAWPASSSIDVETRARLSEQSRALVDTAPVPVLAPADASLASRATIIIGETWAAVSIRTDAVTIALQGSGMAHLYPGIRPMAGTHTVRGIDGFVTQNEGIWSASWKEHGVAYDLSLECADLKAAQCRDASTLLSIADSLVYVGGRGEARR